MRCITVAECESLFGASGFRVSLEHSWYRAALYLERGIAAKQTRLGCRPCSDSSSLCRFADELNRWLPPNKHRLLWIDHWDSDYPNTLEAVLAVRRGMGDTRSLSEAPGHYFDPHPFDKWDQLAMSQQHLSEVSLLVGLLVLLMVNSWDGWLLAEDSVDRIEFWEGNIFFHSEDQSRIQQANATIDTYACSRELQ